MLYLHIRLCDEFFVKDRGHKIPVGRTIAWCESHRCQLQVVLPPRSALDVT